MKIYICSILILCSFFAKAHEYRLQTRRITVEDGLPNDFVYQTMQDRDGFMWVATNYGYCRFDGYEAEIYYEQVDKKRKSARYNSVTAILQDQAGKLWIIYNHFAAWQTASNTMMIEIFDPLSKEALSFDQYFGQKAPFAMTEVIFVSGINEHKVWLVTTQGEVYTYDGSFCKIATLPTCLLHNNPLYILVASSKETLWLLDYNSLILYEVQDNGTLQTTLMPADHFDREDIRNTPRVDEKGILWMAMHTSNEIWSKAPNQPIHKQQFHINKELESFTTNVNSAEFLLKDQAARYWYICNDHIFVFDRHLKLLAHSVSGQKKRAPFGTIYNAMIDKLGQLWLSSNVGITLVSLYTSPFHNYLTNKGIQDVRGIIVDEQNNIYVSQSGLFEVSKGERLLSKYRVSLTGNIKDGNYIIASQYSNKLYKIDLNTGAESYIPTDKGLINKNAFASVLYNSKKTGRIWVGGYLLLGYLNESKDSVLLFTKYNNFSSLKNCSIQFFFENEEGIWLCTDKGLYLLDEQKGVLQYFNDIFPYANLMYLHQDKAGIFWIATRGGGLLRWDRRTDQFTQFTQKEGLSNDVIYAVYEDDYGYLWLPSNYGLMRMNKATYEVSTYLPKDGIPHHEFNFTSHFRAPDGRLFFGGLGGVTAFHPKDFIQPVASDAPFHVINFKKLHANTGALQDFTKTLLTNNRITLYPGERSFFLKIALLNYQKSKSNQYAYRIEGLEKDWKFIAGNSLYLGGLPYGNYTLHIKALDVNGVWAKQTLFIPIQVLPPIYLQTWFLIIIFVITLILAYIVFRWRTLRLIKDRQHLAAEVARRTATIEQQAAELQALNEQKSKFFLNIAHDLRTPLTFIITPITHFLQEEPADERVKKFLQSIHRNAYHLLGLVEGILDLSKIDRQALTLQEKPVYLYPLIRLIFSMYESYAKMHHLTYTLHYEADAQLYLLLDKEKFEKIIHNLLANALRYNIKNGTVKLYIKASADSIYIQVIDTGIGIHPQDLPHIFERYYQSQQPDAPIQGGSGVGLAIAQEYARLMQGELTVQSRLGEGSTFTLVLPKKLAMAPPSTNTIAADIALLSAATPEILPSSIKACRHEHKPALLIVEDNVEMQELLWQITTSHYEITRAENGVAALEILKNKTVDCIVTDLMMPQMDGFELISLLKKNPFWQHIPVVVLTARANEQDKIQVLRMGIDDYLHKPFSAQELLVRLENLIINYQHRQKYQQIQALSSESLVSADQQWLQLLEEKVLQILQRNPSFTLLDVADEINISERHLRRKLQEIAGMGANDYIREIRLQKARRLLEHKVMNTVSEISYAVGFTSVSYFSKVYVERFGKKPSEYLSNVTEKPQL